MASFPKYIKAVENLLDIQLEDTIFFSSQTVSDFLSNTENNLIDWLEKLYSTVTAYTPKLISVLTDFAAPGMELCARLHHFDLYACRQGALHPADKKAVICAL